MDKAELKAQIDKILAYLSDIDVHLHDEGRITMDEYETEDYPDRFTHGPGLERIEKALTEIPEVFAPRKTTNRKISSYELKHILEDYMEKKTGKNASISHGGFIVAMLLSGYIAQWDIFGMKKDVDFNCRVVKRG